MSGLPPSTAASSQVASSVADGAVRFPFRFAPSYARLARVFGITPGRAWVEVGATHLRARYGPWHLHTPLANVVSWKVTGPYRFFKTAGPARLAVTDRGLTFASNGDRGLLICFAETVPGMEPTGILRHPELTVTVADPEGLAARLAAARPR